MQEAFYSHFGSNLKMLLSEPARSEVSQLLNEYPYGEVKNDCIDIIMDDIQTYLLSGIEEYVHNNPRDKFSSIVRAVLATAVRMVDEYNLATNILDEMREGTI